MSDEVVEVYSDLEIAVGQFIYEQRFQSQGGVWSAVNPNHKPVWFELARELIDFIDNYAVNNEESNA